MRNRRCIRSTVEALPLEARRLLADPSFNLSNGALTLSADTTSTDPQTITVTLSNDRIRATATKNGTQTLTQSWTVKSVKDIRIVGGNGNDLLKLADNISQPCIIGGLAGNDTLVGGSGNDNIAGSSGNDVLDGGRGSDLLQGGGGIDTVTYASRSRNVTVTTNSQGQVVGGEAKENDVLQTITNLIGGKGNDKFDLGNGVPGGFGVKFEGGDGNDTLYGTQNGDILFGNGGKDYIEGRAGNDDIDGNAGDDRLLGGDGADSLDGGSGKDYLHGGAGIDLIYGGAARDSIYAKDGAVDIIDGGSGNDVLKERDKNENVKSVP